MYEIIYFLPQEASAPRGGFMVDRRKKKRKKNMDVYAYIQKKKTMKVCFLNAIALKPSGDLVRGRRTLKRGSAFNLQEFWPSACRVHLLEAIKI